MTGLIDWHSHHTPPELVERYTALGARPPATDPEDTDDFGTRRAALDACGVEVQLVSQTAGGGADALSVEDERSLVRASNDAIADRIATEPDRFIGSIAISFREYSRSRPSA